MHQHLASSEYKKRLLGTAMDSWYKVGSWKLTRVCEGDVVRRGGTNAKMTVSTENSHFLVNYSPLD